MSTHKFKEMERREKAFVLPTIALICFGAMGYFLGELCGSYMDEWPLCSASSVLSSLWYDKYLLLLAVSIVVGALLYRGMTFLCKANDGRRWVRSSLAVILAIFNIFMATACIAASIDTDDLHPIYEGSDVAWYASRSEEILRLRSKSVWFGRGEHYYTYPELLLRENYMEADEIAIEVMDKEKTSSYCAFVRWRSETLLPVLTYCYGKWVGFLYSGIVAFWFIGSIVGFSAVKAKGMKALYGSCMGLVGTQLMLTLLDYYGITCWEMPVVFSTADWTAMITVATIQLTVMLFLVCESSNKQHPLLV